MQDENRKSSDKDQEEIDFRKLLRETWINTSIERDKTIVTISSAGLGLIVAFLDKLHDANCLVHLIILFGLLGFLASIIGGVWCFHYNRQVVESVLDGKEEPKFSAPDNLLLSGFFIGIFSIVIIGIALIFNY
jgi:uncharacterized Tic20 family protein